MTKRAAWAIVITSSNNYIKGVVSIKKALHDVHHSRHPLLVLYTSAVNENIVQMLEDIGCIVKPIESIVPRGNVVYTAERFIETWTKMVVWDQVEYSRIVLLDADMLPLQNMDELMTMDLPNKDWIAASHACICNPMGIQHYPAHWIPENCAYTEPSTRLYHYFNSGLIVLTPDHEMFLHMVDVLNTTEDLNIYPFPDQDFLNEIFKHRWHTLPYTYNALKTLKGAHRAMWDVGDVKNIHYIMAKPWDCSRKQKLPEHEVQFKPLYDLWWDQYDTIAAHMDDLDELIHAP